MTPSVREPTTSGYAPQYDAADSARAARSYVDEILEKDAELRSSKPVSPERRKRGRWLLTFSVPLFAILTVLNIRVRTGPVEVMPPTQATEEARIGVYLAMQQVEAFRQANGLELPASLESIGADAPGVEYTPQGNRYSITARVYESTAAYTLGDDTTPFEAAATRLIDPTGRSQ